MAKPGEPARATVVECDPTTLQVDMAAFPDREESLIYEHLKYYCSKFEPLPAAIATLRGTNLVVVQGHKYVAIARELGRRFLRVVVMNFTRKDLEEFLRRGNVTLIEWDLLKREEAETDVMDDFWHVFFFLSSLSDKDKRSFEQRVAGFFRIVQSVLLQGRDRKVSPVQYSHADKSAAFTATTPVGDQAWVEDFFDACKEFSEHYVPIESYQGRRFSL